MWRALLLPAIVLGITPGARAQELAQIPPHAPDTLPAWAHSPENMDSNAALFGSAKFFKNMVVVRFEPMATDRERAAAVAAVKGRVIGGVAGYYCLFVTDRRHGAGLRKAARVLKKMPGVTHAMVDLSVEGLIGPAALP